MSLKIKFNRILILSFLIFFLKLDILYTQEKSLSSLTNREACQLYYSSIAQSKDSRSKGMYYSHSFLDLGFDIKQDWVNDGKQYEKKVVRDKDGYLIVGNIYNPKVSEMINIGDSIISFGGKNLKNIGFDEYIDFILTKKQNEEISSTFKTKKNKRYTVNLKREYNTYLKADYAIDSFSINSINIKNNSYNLSITQDFSYFWQFKNNINKDEDHILYKLAIGNILFEEYENDWHYYLCNPDNDDFAFSQLLDPSTYQVRNLKAADKSLERLINEITPYSTLKGVDNSLNAINVSRIKSNVLEIKNEFNLKSFPFDKQKLVFEVLDNEYNNDVRTLNLTSKVYKILDDFMSIDDIPGWEKKSYDLSYVSEHLIGMMDGEYSQGFSLEIELERKIGYYIFKVIFPIILILSICWASVWINPRELESRLTITIVCLLSLIAYNFVIDSELPKLEYLTVLDWIILISYIYATIPNILSVYSFRISTTNKLMCEKVEGLAREFGLVSYIGLIVLIIMLNANLNPENSGSLISWMAVTD